MDNEESLPIAPKPLHAVPNEVVLQPDRTVGWWGDREDDAERLGFIPTQKPKRFTKVSPKGYNG